MLMLLEAEYQAVAIATCEIIWILALLNDICFMENICQDKLHGKHLISNV